MVQLSSIWRMAGRDFGVSECIIAFIPLRFAM